jgi:hypothetical protein
MPSANKMPQITENVWARDVIISRWNISVVIHKHGLLDWYVPAMGLIQHSYTWLKVLS